MRHTLRNTALSLALLGSLGCAADEAAEAVDAPTSEVPIVKAEEGKADTSAVAVVLDFAFDGKLLTDTSWRPEAQIEEQLLYTVGQLNGSKAVGRLDKVVLTNVETETVSDGEGRDATEVRYSASVQVAWTKAQGLPTKYTFKLPKDVSYQGKQAFTDKYNHDCVDWGAHDVTPGSMWYYYRPARSGCRIDDADIFEAEATVTVSPVNTTGKYPEYDRVWEDGVFRVTAVFGKYEDGATTSADAGVAAYGKFHSEMKRLLAPHSLEISPEFSGNPGVDTPEVVFTATLDEGHRVEITAIMVDNVRTAGRDFDERYGELSKTADLIVYNGHAGLGANIRALARKGSWVAGQYVMVFMNGCDTYAYVDSALFEAHADVNPDDPMGTKHTDVITNALPSFFASMAGATTALIRGIITYDEPLTYEQIFAKVDAKQVVLVSGEEDNTYVPGGGGEQPVSWDGLSSSGDLGRDEEARSETPTLEPGRYTFAITGSGDADLYVRIGLEPTKSAYDCRPYKSGSAERCEIDLNAPAKVHVMVRGYSANSSFELVGSPE